MSVAAPAAGTGVNRGAVHANFWSTHLSEVDATKAKYDHAYETITENVGDVEVMGYWEAPGEAKHWPDGQARSYQGMKSASFNVVTRRWEDSIKWEIATKENDRTRTLVPVAREKGKSFGRIPRRVFFQILTGATDTDLLPSIPVAPDGGALYSAFEGDGATDRFRTTDGNLHAGTGVTTVAKIITDFYAATSKLVRFQNSGRRQVFDESIFEDGFIVYYNSVLAEVFEVAFKGQIVPSIAGTAAQSNVLITATGKNVELRPSPEITDNDWYVFLRKPPEGKKPLVHTIARPLTETPFNKESGSDLARDEDVEGFAYDSREGFGIAPPWCTVKVNN